MGEQRNQKSEVMIIFSVWDDQHQHQQSSFIMAMSTNISIIMRTDMIDNRPMQEPANRTRGEGASEATTGRGSPAHRNNKD